MNRLLGVAGAAAVLWCLSISGLPHRRFQPHCRSGEEIRRAP